MAREYKLNQLDELLSTFDYPASREHLVDACDDVTLLLADGEQNLGTLLETAGSDRFDSADDLSSEVFGLLPREAVGEPYQSEGEG